MNGSSQRDGGLEAGALSNGKWLSVAGWWVLAIGVGLVLDGFVPRLMQPYASLVRQSGVSHELKESGHFVFTIIVAALLWILHPWRWRGGAFLCLCGMMAGLFYTLGKTLLGRTRPVVEIAPFKFHLAGWAERALHGHNASFPSGHTTLAFATAAALAYILPRGRWAFFVCAALLGLERVGELAHYPSDVVVSAGLGLLAFELVRRLVGPMILPPGEGAIGAAPAEWDGVDTRGGGRGGMVAAEGGGNAARFGQLRPA